MKNIARLAILSALLGLSAKAAPFMAIGDSAELFVTASATVTSDSNIYLDANNATSDTIFAVTPGLDLVFGKGSYTQGDVNVSDQIRRYSSNSENNVNLPYYGGSAYYNNGVTKASIIVNYGKYSQNTFTSKLVNGIVQYDMGLANAQIELPVTEKTKVGAGLVYQHVDTAGGSTIETITAPVDVYFAASPTLDWSAGYQYRNNSFANPGGATVSSNDNFFNLGARGQFTPLLSGQIRIGEMSRSFDTGQNLSTFSYNGALTYAYSAKTSFGLTFDRGYGTAGFIAASNTTTDYGITASTTFTEQWSMNASLTYSDVAYATQTLKYLNGTVGINYIYSRSINFGASVVLSKATSNPTGSGFSDNMFTFTANFRY